MNLFLPYAKIALESLVLPTASQVDGPLADCFVGLLTVAPAFTRATVAADCTEVDFDGYARVALTWSEPYLSSDENEESILSSRPSFRPTAGTNLPQTVVGVGIWDAITGGNLVGYEQLDEEFVFSDTDSMLSPEVDLRRDVLESYGVVIVDR